jgi:hypothetical protein
MIGFWSKSIMNPQYEFISKQQEQLISLAQLNKLLQKRQVQRYGVWGKFIGRFGDVLIDSGSWMKRVSSAPVEDNSAGIYTQN